MVAKRAARVGKLKPWGILAAPPFRDWAEIVQELPSDLGLELCMLVRHVRLVAQCSVERRKRLFAARPAAHVSERRSRALSAAPLDLHSDLHLLMRITERRPPADEEVAAACEAVAEWAQDSGFPKTALHLAEAGAAIRPKDAHTAFVAGRLNRVLGEPWRAEVYYSRAIRLAQREQRWPVYVRANLGLARLLADSGRAATAGKHYGMAARAAFDQGVDWLAAQTYHDLMLLHFEHGDLAKATHFVLKALEAYPRHHERYPIAVHDLAFVLVVQHHYSDALPLLQLLSRAPLSPIDQVLVSGSLARAAGGVGSEDLYGDGESRVLRLAPHHGFHAPAAMVNLAFGARALTRWDLAQVYAERGIAAAEEKGQGFVAQVGRSLLGEVQARTPSPPPAPPIGGGTAKALRALSATVQKQLGTWRADAGTKKENAEGTWAVGQV